ncbi:hypothetical protein MDAP_001478 [Mitosporidium daphniae]
MLLLVFLIGLYFFASCIVFAIYCPTGSDEAIKYISLFYLFEYYDINVLFKKFGFAILVLFVITFTLLRSLLPHPSFSKIPTITSKMLIRLGLILLTFTFWYGLIIQIAKPFFKRSYYGINISGHCFLLIWTLLSIPNCISLLSCHVKCQSIFTHGSTSKKMAYISRKAVNIISIFSFAYLILVSFLLLQTFFFFHSSLEKIVGGVLAISGHAFLVAIDFLDFA